ncbi:hypothetical protein QTP70_017031 [Hemibagrus guttatus]|uniref:EGF-like domain-containing protein n=1 Tax=Hemibagrus guttatus TaxID=175788 RepID=A0AAE0QZL8_9TELE|nr:hypothetical protein QTP70_017031 [Hemibagrus guttatus]
MALKSGLFLTLFLFTLQASGIKVLSRDHLSGNRNVKYRHFYEDSRAARHLSAVRDSLFLNKLRVKRSALFSTGVRACPQENMAEVIASHKSYYKLRGSEEKFAMDLEKPDFLLAKVSAVQHIIEFSVTVKDPDYIQLQRDHGHVQYHDAPHSLHVQITSSSHLVSLSVDEMLFVPLQMLQIFNKLAGFKEIRLLGIQQMSSPESIAVHYAMVFETEVDSTRIGTTGTESDTEIALKDMILKALREDPSLSLDIRSLSFEPTTQNHLKDLPTDRPEHLPWVIKTQAALAISEDTTESINISEEEEAPKGTQGRVEEAIESTFPRQETRYKRNTSLDSLLKVSEVEQALGNEIAAMPTELNLNSMKAVRASTSNQYSESEVDVSEASFKDKISAMPYFTQTEMPKAEDTAGIATVAMDGISETPEASSFTENSERRSSSKQNKKEQQTLASISSDLTGFKELHILNFRNGSVVVNKKMKLAKPEVDNLTTAVHCSLDKLTTSNAASKKDIGIDSHPADPCKYMNCNEFSHCVVNMLNSEAECLCDPGYSTVDGLPCQSICNLQPNYCLNGGLCENIPGRGASCRCPSGKYWYYDGEHCSELVSVPVDPVIFVLCLMGGLTVVCAVIGLLVFINRNCIRTRKTVTLVRSHSHLSMEGIMRVNPVFENDDGILTHVSSINSGSSQPSDQVSFYSLENMRLSIEVKCTVQKVS